MILNDIKTNPVNKEIYGKGGSVDDLKESMKKYGLENPIVVDQNGVLLSGHRRFQAALELGWEKIPHIIKKVADENESIEYLIRQNLYRTKTNAMIKNEIEKISAVEKRKAELRKLSNLKNHSNFEDTDLLNAVKGRVDKVIAKKLNTNEGFVRSSFKFSDLTKDMEIDELDFYTGLFNVNVSGSLEAIELDLFKKLKEEKVETLTKDPKRLRTYIKDFKLDKYKSRYNVVYIEPEWEGKIVEKLTDEEKYPVNSITQSNAGFFVLATPEYLSEALQIMIRWGFKYYTNYVWTFKDKTTGDLKHKILLLGKKGKWEFEQFEGTPGIKESDSMPFMKHIKTEAFKNYGLVLNDEEIDEFDNLDEVIDGMIKTSTELVDAEGL